MEYLATMQLVFDQISLWFDTLFDMNCDFSQSKISVIWYFVITKCDINLVWLEKQTSRSPGCSR